MSLRLRIALSAALLVAATALGIGYWVAAAIGDRLRNNIGSELAETAYQMSDKLDREMASRTGEVELLTSLEALQRNDVAEAQRLVDTLHNTIPAFSWIGLLDPAGVVIAASEGILLGEDISHRPVFIEGSKGIFIGDVHDAVLLASLLPNPSGEPMKFVDIAISLPKKDDRGPRVLAAHLSWTWAEEVRRSILREAYSHRGISLYVASAGGDVLLSRGNDLLGHNLRLKAMQRAKNGEEVGWTVEQWPDGQTYLTGFARADGHLNYPGLGWVVLTREPAEMAFAPIEEFWQLTALVSTGLVISIAVLGWFALGGVTNRLAHIADVAREIRAGQQVDMPLYDSPREVADLSHALRNLVVELTHSEQALDRMSAVARQDRLTGLPNRLGMVSFFDVAVARAKREGLSIIAFYIDLDGFKAVNDTMGHGAGDEALKEVAARLKSCSRGGELAVRLGGDEFLMLIFADAADWEKTASQVARRVLARLAEPYVLSEGQAQMAGSIGIARYPYDGDTLETLLAKSDKALYAAKRGGKNRAVFAASEKVVMLGSHSTRK
ncbi:sensor domain-containing diguanylate cyclase [Hwanghaeella grinnelliae]|uniref:Sensor domain-containing diguanylate cyclase n=1 Tax=Hwanghaeella grinnelliae TaxID=2500179 RepID=A0A3S2VNF0_9PROT|nr:diguanylate cyclase [Hwanghaeella grinnelliae]RVU34696.1 sensor domain-containing diguanylate cyclase [Hwanghaeella grinnelliae]